MGGTTQNLFVQDMPRLSVDIDVVFTNHRARSEGCAEGYCKVFRRASSLVLFIVCFFCLRSAATVALAYLSNSFHASLDLYDHKLLYVADL